MRTDGPQRSRKHLQHRTRSPGTRRLECPVIRCTACKEAAVTSHGCGCSYLTHGWGACKCALLPGHTSASCAAAKLRASSSVLAVNNTLMTCIGGRNVLRPAPSLGFLLSQATATAVTPMRCMLHVCRRSCVSAGKYEIATSTQHAAALHGPRSAGLPDASTFCKWRRTPGASKACSACTSAAVSIQRSIGGSNEPAAGTSSVANCCLTAAEAT